MAGLNSIQVGEDLDQAMEPNDLVEFQAIVELVLVEYTDTAEVLDDDEEIFGGGIYSDMSLKETVMHHQKTFSSCYPHRVSNMISSGMSVTGFGEEKQIVLQKHL
jgi:hypothetical protein